MLLFVVNADLLSRLVLRNPHIKGVKFRQQELKVQQYADDTTFFVTDKNSITELFRNIDTYCKATGQKLNAQKTEILPCSKFIREIVRKHHHDFMKKEIKILGVQYLASGANVEKNSNKVTSKIIAIVEEHKKRS